ncbi:MAG: dihydroneopterin aldolase [Alphaproteobacteria bacterium]|nr:dihydroneopterin aldolase [Alphaproteobacteria bacterium]
MRYRIFLRDFERSAAIGIHPHEQGITQPVRFDVRLEVLAPQAAETDQIDNTVSYEGIVAIIDEELASGHVGLVEKLAETIAQRCLADKRVQEVWVRIEKPTAIPSGIAGVEITRVQT